VLQKRWGGGTDPLVSAAAQSVAAAVVVAPVAAVAGGHFEVSAQLVLCLAWITLGLAVGTLLLYVHLLRLHAASTVTALLLLVPPVTAFASALTLGEALHPASLAGMLVALAGVGVVLGRARGTLRVWPERPVHTPRRRRSDDEDAHHRPLDPAAVPTR
jgi:drug/metabolite transporter (DMT)-like permease